MQVVPLTTYERVTGMCGSLSQVPTWSCRFFLRMVNKGKLEEGQQLTVKSLTWQQVHAWRLSQHCLSPRVERQDYLKAVTRTGGIQAQVMSAAELALWARVDGLIRQDVQAAL